MFFSGVIYTFHTLFVESTLYQNQQNLAAIYNILKKPASLKVVKVLVIFYGERSPQQISRMKFNSELSACSYLQLLVEFAELQGSGAGDLTPEGLQAI